MLRRDFLRSATSAAALSLAGPAALAAQAPLSNGPAAAMPAPFTLPKVRAQADRIIAVTVCTRPFRAQGARIETEKLGRKTVVHNYGHGGAGWSLAWGSSTLAIQLALQTKVPQIAVIGCGALGLTSALLAQRAGLKVKIYAKERPPEVLSTFATGNWSPNSRYCTLEHATPEVAARWEQMARLSFRTYQHMLGLPGEPIEWRDGYRLSETPPGTPGHATEGEPEYPKLDQRIADMTPRQELLAPGTHPFPSTYVRRHANMIYNITALQRLLVSDFLLAGGSIETHGFDSPSDVAKLREKTIVNATGYGARALWGDESITPVRGQLVRLIPQPEITYYLYYNDAVSMMPRRDGIIVQSTAPGDFGSADMTPDRAAAEQSVQILADLTSQMR